MEYGRKEDKMGTYTKNLKLETPSYTDNADIPALTKKNNEIIDSEMIKRANGLDYNEQTGVLQLTGNNSKVGSPIQIKNNLPVTSMASGTELKVNNYKQLIKFTKEGKTEQKTYTGKNLFYDTPSSTTSNGITLTKNSDGSFTLNGTTTGVSIFDFRLPKALPAGTYTFSIEGSDNIHGNVFLRARDNNWAMVETQSQVNGNNTTQNSHTFTCKKDISIVAINITRAGITFNNFVIYPQLEKGTTATKFEPYVGATPSPNPDYPQEIENIKGVGNIIKVKPRTTKEINGLKAISQEDGSIKITGTATAVTEFTMQLETPVTIKNNIYTYSVKSIGSVPSCATRLLKQNTASSETSFGKTYTSLKSNDTVKITSSVTDEESYNYFFFYCNKDTTVNATLYPQLEKGTIAHTFVLPGSNYLQLEDKTENLIGLDNKQYRVNLKKGDKILAVNNGTTNLNLNLYTNYGDTARNDFFTIAANSQRLIVIANDSHAIAWGGTLDNIAWVVKGEKFIPYEPYQEKIINVDLKGNNLCSDRDKTIRDELLVENGKAKIIKKYDEVVLNGSENWTKSGSSNSSRFIASLEITKIMKTKTFNALCNYFTYNIEFGIAKFHLFNTNTDGTARFIAFGVDPSTISDLTQWKALLKSLYDSGNPVKVQYQLAEPEVIDLGEVDFDLIENSTLTCEEESDMQLDYLTIDSNIFVQDSLDGSSSQKAPSIDAIKKYFGKKVYDKDANGWIKIEFFDHTEYVAEGQITQIDFSTGWGVSKLLSLPVGMSKIGDRILSGNVRTFDAAISVNISGVLTETQITYNWKNNHSSNVTTGLNYSLRILEYV